MVEAGPQSEARPNGHVRAHVTRQRAPERFVGFGAKNQRGPRVQMRTVTLLSAGGFFPYFPRATSEASD